MGLGFVGCLQSLAKPVFEIRANLISRSFEARGTFLDFALFVEKGDQGSLLSPQMERDDEYG